MKYKFWLLVSLFVTPFFISCKGKTTSVSGNNDSISTEEKPMIADRVPFDADSAYLFVEKQLSFGPRIADTDAHKNCREWIEGKLRSYGYDVDIQTFNGVDYYKKQVKGYNIITRINPEKKNRILLLAHYDNRQVSDNDPDKNNFNKPIMGADDGASGVAILMEILRTISTNTYMRNNFALDVLFVDLEDNGRTAADGGDDDDWCLGSKYYANEEKKSSNKPVFGILLDMVGGKDAKFCLEQYSKVYAARYQSSIWTLARELGYGDYFSPKDGGAITDDHVPLITIAGIPTVDIINFDSDRDGGFPFYWHTQKDNISNIDKNTLKAVGETVLTFINKPL